MKKLRHLYVQVLIAIVLGVILVYSEPAWGAAMKPLATLNRPVLKTVDVETKEATVSFKERTDVTAVPAAGVVAETMVALVVADEALRKFGGDSVAELVRNHDAYIASLS